jgi:hypothetical protein
MHAASSAVSEKRLVMCLSRFGVGSPITKRQRLYLMPHIRKAFLVFEEEIEILILFD